MKPLILMLLFAIAVEAQSLPEVARKERERQAKVKSVHVYSNEDAKTAPTRPESTTAQGTTEAKPSATAARPGNRSIRSRRRSGSCG